LGSVSHQLYLDTTLIHAFVRVEMYSAYEKDDPVNVDGDGTK
jgi:hypothetical protein